MKGIIFVTFTTVLFTTALTAHVGVPLPGYISRYGFIAGGPYGPKHGGTANVNVGQNANSFNFGVKENGAHYRKFVYQTGAFDNVAVPVAVPVPVAAPVITTVSGSFIPSRGPLF